MSHDEFLAGFLVAVIIGGLGWVLAVATFRAFSSTLGELRLSQKKLAIFHQEVVQAEAALRLERSTVAILKRQYDEMTQLAHQYGSPRSELDATTEKLLRLALQNSNDNEAKNAALAVCRRLSRKL